MAIVPTYTFTLAPGVDFPEAEATLRLAVLAVEGLLGEARVRLETAWRADPASRALTVDAGTLSGDAVGRIFTAYLSCEFGPGAFTVRRAHAGVAGPVAAGEGVAA